MYFWKTHLLVEDLKNNSLDETNLKNYYLATSILISVCYYLAMMSPKAYPPAMVFEAISTIIITVLGINAAFKANGGPSGVHFLNKVVSITFPLLIKVLISGFVLGIFVEMLTIAGASQLQTDWVTSIAIVIMQIVLYWRLAVHVRRTNA